MWPIALSVIGGLILGYIFYPVYKVVLRVVKEKNISALIIVLLILFLIFIPLWFLFPVVSSQIFDAYLYTQKVDFSSLLSGILPEAVSKDTTSLVNGFISNLVNSLFSKFSQILLNIPDLLLQAAVILFVFFFAMRDGEKMKEFAKGISPFAPHTEESISKQFKEITGSVIYGHIVVGIIQGLLTGAGLYLFGVPQVLLLTLLACLASVMPIIGAWLIWIPAVVYLLISGHTEAGVALFLWGAILVSWVDNILRPYIVSRRSNVNSGIVLVGMIGGLLIFGVLGLILGPLILSYLIVLLDAYKNKKLSAFFK
jgi:predicted PurR-regulated permease PerM